MRQLTHSVLLLCVCAMVAYGDEGDHQFARTMLQEESALRSWIEQNGGFVHSDLVIRGVEGDNYNKGSRGVFARQDLAFGTLLMSVPPTIMMSQSTLLQSSLGDVVLNQLGASPTNAIALHLLWETYGLKEQSFFAPYLAILPTTAQMTTTIFYNEEELSALQASSLIPFTKQRLGAVERHYRNLVKEFSQILQRGGIGSHGALIPYADMFNAAPLERLPISDDDEKEELKIMKTRSTSQLRVDARPDGTIKLYLSRDVKSGEELLADYSQRGGQGLSNAELLFDYGYVCTSNPFDFAIVPNPIDPKDSKRNRKLDDLGIRMPYFRIHRNEFPGSLMAACRIAAAAPDDLLRVDGRGRMVDVTLETDRKAVALAKALLDHALASYTTTVEEDRELLEQLSSCRQQREECDEKLWMAVVVRLGEKEVLESAVVQIRDFARNLMRMSETPTKSLEDVGQDVRL